LAVGDSPIPGYWTTKGAAQHAGLHPDTIRYHCRTGTLAGQASMSGRDYLIPDEALTQFMAARVRMGREL
jgi:hypothetical protein